VFKRLIVTTGLILCLILTTCIVACDNSSNTQIENGNSNLPDPLPNVAAVVAKVKPSVVAINVEAIDYDFFNRPIREQGAGSGWIIDEDGYIVTNNHVVENADIITVTLDDGRVITAEEVSTDVLTDLAVIKVEASNLPTLEIGNSDNLGIGDWVVVIGNSLGRGISATQGIVSSSHVSLAVSTGQTLDDLIQTDAAINPGNSGGPLVNMSGEVIGITSAKVAEVGVEGMGYAISSTEAVPIIEQLIDKGYVVRPSLEASTTSVTQWVATIYRLSVNRGALVTAVVKDGPADKAGLKAGDVITAIDEKSIASSTDLTQTIISKQINQSVEVTYWRGRNSYQTNATLVESPPPDSN